MDVEKKSAIRRVGQHVFFGLSYAVCKVAQEVGMERETPTVFELKEANED